MYKGLLYSERMYNRVSLTKMIELFKFHLLICNKHCQRRLLGGKVSSTYTQWGDSYIEHNRDSSIGSPLCIAIHFTYVL